MALHRWHTNLALGIAATALLLGGCGRGRVNAPSLGAHMKPAAMGVRSAPAATALGRAAQAALAGLAEATAAYKAGGLDRGGARKLDAKGAAAVRQIALGVAQKLEAAAKAAEGELANGEANEQSLGKSWGAKAPVLGADAPPGEDAAAALYQVAQWRLKLSALVEAAYRAGALPAAGQDKPEAGTPAPLVVAPPTPAETPIAL